MRRHTAKENIISALVGIVIGVPIAWYGVTHLTTTETEVTTTSYVPTTEIEEVSADREETEVSQDEVILLEETPDDIEAEMYYDELGLLAQLVAAEAEGQSLDAKRRIVDVVLNRVDSDAFPDTITDVIYQKNQFTPMWNGRFERAAYAITEEDFEAVRLELENRTDPYIFYFTAGYYASYGRDAYTIGNIYFSYMK